MLHNIKLFSIFLSLSIFATSASASLSANSCERLHERMNPTSSKILQQAVVGNKGFHTYFHTGPSNRCKVKNLSLIPRDLIQTGLYVMDGKEKWIYASYEQRNGSTIEGWLKSKDFKTIRVIEEH